MINVSWLNTDFLLKYGLWGKIPLDESNALVLAWITKSEDVSVKEKFSKAKNSIWCHFYKVKETLTIEISGKDLDLYDCRSLNYLDIGWRGKGASMLFALAHTKRQPSKTLGEVGTAGEIEWG